MDSLGAWSIFGALILLVILFSWFLVNYYISSSEKSIFSIVTVTASYALSILCGFLIPLDVFEIADKSPPDTLNFTTNEVKHLYYYLYLLALGISFLVTPFVYFSDPEQQAPRNPDIDHDIETDVARMGKSCKKALVVVFIEAVLLTLAVVLRPNLDGGVWPRQFEKSWINQTFDVSNSGEQVYVFIMALLISLGVIFWIMNSAYGLATLPLYLIKGAKSLNETKKELDEDLMELKEEYRTIKDKYSRSYTDVPSDDQRKLDQIKQKEKRIIQKQVMIDQEKDKTCIQILLKAITPFRVSIGFVMLVISLGLFVSVLLTTLDRILNSKCGFTCGFIIEKSQYMNPVDFGLVFASQYFPLDYLIFAIMVIYIFLSSLYGIIKMGPKLPFAKGYEIKKDNTSPQGLLLSGVIMTLTILAVSAEMKNIVPQYTTFGSQTYFNSATMKNDPCTLETVTDNPDICTISVIAALTNKISLSLPYLSFVFLIGNVLFLCSFTGYFLYALCTKEKNFIEDKVESMQEETNEFSKLTDDIDF